MLRYIHGRDLAALPRLRETMHQDRADQFQRRLGWPVTVDARGWETDEYDALDPLYVIWELPDGRHGGSMRFLPTTGRTMVNDHFLHLTSNVAIRSPFIWECTRFCLAREAPSRVASALMLAGGELMRAFDLSHFVGVFDAHMTRVYRMIGALPEVLGNSGCGRGAISVGLWSYDAGVRDSLLARAGVTSDLSEHWFVRSFGHPVALSLTA